MNQQSFFGTREAFIQRYVAIDQNVMRGGFGAVRKYRDTNNNDRIVAVKTVIPKVKDIEQQRSRRRGNYIEREIDILRAVQHPNLLCLVDPTVYFVQSQDGPQFLMVTDYMEQELYDYIHDPAWIHGRPLPAIRPAVLPIDTVKNICLQIGLGLQYLHSKNIVHRDLKLENVMVNSNRGDPNFPLEVKIIDFGLSRELDNGSNYSKRLGSKKYMPPEIRTLEGAYTQRADMWSFGIIIFVLLAQRYPFRDDKQTEFPKIEEGVQFGSHPNFDEQTNPDAAINLDVINRLLCPQFDRLTSTDFLTHAFMNNYYTGFDDSLNPFNSEADTTQPETLMHIRIPNSSRNFRIILSTMDFKDLDDPDATVLVSIQNKNLPFLQNFQDSDAKAFETNFQVGSSSPPVLQPNSSSSISNPVNDDNLDITSGNSGLQLSRNKSWNYQSDILASKDQEGKARLGSLGKMLAQLHYEDGQDIPVTNYDNVLVKFAIENSPIHQVLQEMEGLLDAPDEDPKIPCRNLFSIIIDTEDGDVDSNTADISKTVKRTWRIYSSLRRNADKIVAGDDTNLYMSLIGYNKRDENGNELDRAAKIKLCQQVSQEIANFAAYLTKRVDPKKLNTFTILVFGDIFNLIKGAFRALGHSGVMNVIHDSQYLNHLSSRIRTDYKNIIVKFKPLLVTYINCTIAKMDQSTYDPLAHCLQICYWGGRVADVIREIKAENEENESMQEEENEESQRSNFAFILNEDHAIEILERNAIKAGKKSPYLESLEVFDAATTLVALDYLLKNAKYLQVITEEG